ncbi:MAG: BMC domain-containing protein [Pirellula sp.]
MAKAANVKILKRVSIGNAFVATIVQGDVGSVRAAVESGANAPRRTWPLRSYVPREGCSCDSQG